MATSAVPPYFLVAFTAVSMLPDIVQRVEQTEMMSMPVFNTLFDEELHHIIEA